MRTFKIITFFSLFIAFFSCKKDSPAPKSPIIQQLPQADNPGEYYGKMEISFQVDHTQQLLDSTMNISCRIYKTPVNAFGPTDTWDTVFVNNLLLATNSAPEYVFYDLPPPKLLSQFINTKWTYYSQDAGYTSVIDNQSIGSISSANTLSITISLSAPTTTISLGNISNCDYAVLHFEEPNIVMPSNNAKLVLHSEDYSTFSLGPWSIGIELVSEKDVVYNGKKYRLIKRVVHFVPANVIP